MSNLAKDLWKFCNDIRGFFRLKKSEYYKPVLGIIFLKYMDLSYQRALKEIEKHLPIVNGIPIKPDKNDFIEKGAVELPKEAQFSWIINLPEDIASMGLNDSKGKHLNNLGEILDNAMKIIENQAELLEGSLFKEYHKLRDNALRELISGFEREDISKNPDELVEVYRYFLGEFSLVEKEDKGVFFTPKSLVNMMINILEPTRGKVLDPACGSGGMFAWVKKYIEEKTDLICRYQMQFFGYEILPANVNICYMNLFMNNIQANSDIRCCNTFEEDPIKNLQNNCDYVLCSPPLYVAGIGVEKVKSAGRLPFGLPKENKSTFIKADYLWISYFYSYLNEKGKAGFIIGTKTLGDKSDKEIRKKIIETKHIDLIIGVNNRFFQTGLNGEVSLCFFNKDKEKEYEDKILFIDAYNYYSNTKENVRHNNWNEWQFKNLLAIVWLYKGQNDKYQKLLEEYKNTLFDYSNKFGIQLSDSQNYSQVFKEFGKKLIIDGDNTIKSAEKVDKNRIAEEFDQKWKEFEDAWKIVKEYEWIYSKFGDGEYKDIAGLCKVMNIQEIIENDSCLAPVFYVGSEDDPEGELIEGEKMKIMHEELIKLEKESQELTERIINNLKIWSD